MKATLFKFLLTLLLSLAATDFGISLAAGNAYAQNAYAQNFFEGVLVATASNEIRQSSDEGALDPAVIAPAAIAPTAIAYDGRLLADDQSVRLLIDLDRKVDIQPFYMNNPPRLVIDMSKTAFRFQQPDNLKPRGLVSEFRYGTMARGRSRIVISLKYPVKIVMQQLSETALERHRFTLDMEKIEDTEFGELIAGQGDRNYNSGSAPAKGDRLLRITKRAGKRAGKRTAIRTGRMTIVLDPGHGGIDGGAKGKKGALEKDITLKVAFSLEKALKAAGPFDVYLTRRDDHFVSLKERVRISAGKQADLFISIHADTLRQKRIRGSAIYTLSKKASDEFAKRLADAENRADLTAGLPNIEVGEEIVDILADMAARETKKFSVSFARRVVDEFRDNLEMIKNPHRNAAFEVLKDPNTPSVLLEMGYLSNLQDEKLLQSKQWRAKFAHHMSKAVGQFFANRMQ